MSKKYKELSENEQLIRSFFSASQIITGDPERVYNLIKNNKNGSLKLSGPDEDGFIVFTLHRKQVINYLVPETLYNNIINERFTEENKEDSEALVA